MTDAFRAFRISQSFSLVTICKKRRPDDRLTVTAKERPREKHETTYLDGVERRHVSGEKAFHASVSEAEGAQI
jgi:hypothetical protein